MEQSFQFFAVFHRQWWIYDSQRVSEDVRQRVLRRAALRRFLVNGVGPPGTLKLVEVGNKLLG